MIPLRDTVPTKNYPVITNVIIGLNVIIYLYQLTRGVGLDIFFYIYGLVPARYSIPQISAYFTTSQQAFSLGTRKLVNIPWGFHKRTFRVAVPAGITEGRKLRLRGLGKQAMTGERGDLFLKVLIRA